MGRWIKKFAGRAQASTDSADTLCRTSALSVSTQAHSQSVPISPHAPDTVVDGTDAELLESALSSTDSVDTLDDAFSESPSVTTDSPDTLDTMSALSVLNQVHPENFPAGSAFAAKPESACPACGSAQWWQLPGQAWHCRACKPDTPLTATTLTLPCHNAQVPPVGAPAGFERRLESACEGLSIAPAQLHAELREGGDLPALGSGALTPKALRLTAKSLAVMRYSFSSPTRGYCDD